MYYPVGLSGSPANPYNGVKVVNGGRYKVWFNRPSGATKAEGYVYNNLTIYDRYMDYWNSAYAHRFRITKKPSSGSDYIYLEGIGGSTGETFGKLALDAYWARGKPIVVNILGTRQGLEGVKYLKITDSNGVDQAPISAPDTPLYGQEPTVDSEDGIEEKFPLLPLLLAVGAVGIVGVVAYYSTRARG